jgi:transcriptional antiterminator RfaH
LNRYFRGKSRKFLVKQTSQWQRFRPYYHQRFCLLQYVKIKTCLGEILREKARPMHEESLHIEPGLRWYAIQTKPNKEKEVEKRLADLRIEVFLPWMRTRRRIGSRFHWVLAPLFPAYLFCRLDLLESGKAARYSPGVRDFLKFGNHIAEVGGEIVAALRERCPGGIAQVELVSVKPGDPVKINEGPFSGLEAIFEKKMKGSERVAVLLDILGRQTRLVLPSETIEKI